MERERLREQLEAGRSIEAIAREVGRDPSTVAYWARKHGLHSAHEARHAARGGVERAQLEAMLEQRLSIREIAQALDRSPTTVRHWMRRYDLRVRRPYSRAPADGRPELMRTCERHGEAVFRRRADGAYRCVLCLSERVTDRRRVLKSTLVAEAGGRCVVCGYDRCVGALHFHHRDPAQKSFGVCQHGSRSLAEARQEAQKCVLLCANCHAEIEEGLLLMGSIPPG